MIQEIQYELGIYVSQTAKEAEKEFSLISELKNENIPLPRT
jgi:hypothetical protein